MNARVFLLKCPQCGNQMKYMTREKSIEEKKKRCVYCGKTYSVREHILHQIDENKKKREK